MGCWRELSGCGRELRAAGAFAFGEFFREQARGTGTKAGSEAALSGFGDFSFGGFFFSPGLDGVVFDGFEGVGGGFRGGGVGGGGFELLHDGEDEGCGDETDGDEDAPEHCGGDFAPQKHGDGDEVVADGCGGEPSAHHGAFELGWRYLADEADAHR